MLRCETYQDRLLDHLYGLLGPAEAAELEAHLAGCPACAAAREQADRWQGLIAHAAKAEFPGVRFTPPVEPAPRPVDPVAPPAVTVRSAWVRWAVALSLFLTACALGGPTAFDLVGYFANKPKVERELAAVEQAKADRNRVAAALQQAQQDLDRKLADARAEHEKVLTDWVTAVRSADQVAAEKPFQVQVSGPASAIPGAPNQFAIRVVGPKGQPRPAAITARVTDGSGAVLLEEEYPADAGPKPLRLPPQVWAQAKAGADLLLSVTAADPANRGTGVTETVRLVDPVLSTHLVTDRPLYRPGETIYYRSLTLDRATFLPPDRDLNLHFVLLNPDGKPVPGLQTVGLARPVHGSPPEPVLGPDGKPVRGIGTGAFRLPANLPGGVYELQVYEVRPDGSKVDGSLPLATRSVLVNRYTPDRLEKTLEFDGKSYGAGDVVQAKVTVRDQGKPVPGAALEYALRVRYESDYEPPVSAVKMEVAPDRTDANGAASIRFTLPKRGDDPIKDAVLTVTVRAKGFVEPLVRSVPVVTRKLTVEFFPEGGDLVAGVPNRVYLRATTSLGKPADIHGVLTDGTKDLGAVRTLTDPDQPGANQGHGVFTFTPEAGKHYTVRLDRPATVIQPTTWRTGPAAAAIGGVAGSMTTGYLLPAAKESGIVLKVPNGIDQTGDKGRGTFKSSDPIPVQLWAVGGKRNVLIGAYTRGRPVVHRRAVVEPGRPTELTLVPTDPKLGGVTRITVFDETDGGEAKPVAERLIYREPAEALTLSVTAGKPGGRPAAGAFVPGEPVELTVRAKDEAGNPTAAVVYAAVVNQSVLAMADEKTAHLLPTYFLLLGEVQNPDDLEHADFLLTDHPQAAAALDQLLGTQGWRRFAEQAPARLNAPPGTPAEQLLVTMGYRGAVPVGWKTAPQKAFDDYWPRYEEVALAVDRLERARQTGAFTRPLQDELAQADAEHNARLTAFGSAAYNLEFYDERMSHRRVMLPVTLAFTIGTAVLLTILRFSRRRQAPERRTLTVGAIGFVLLALFVVFAATVTGLDNRWRVPYQGAPKPQRNNWYGGVRSAATPAPAMAQAGGVGQAEWAPNAMAPQAVRPDAPPAQIEPHTFPQNERPFDPPAQVGPQRPVGRPRADITPPRQDPSGGAAAKLQRALNALSQQQIAEGGEPIPQDLIDKMRRSVPQAPPLVVREYAHQQPEGADPTVRTDFTETLLWQPVLVLPQGGTATVGFDLSDAVTGYRVLVAGHTLTGRLGAVTQTIEVRKPVVADPKLPQEVSSADVIDLPVQITNATDARQAELNVTLTGLKADSLPSAAALKPFDGGRAIVRVTPTAPTGDVKVKVSATAGGNTDTVERTAVVVPDGFPHEGSKADLLEKRTLATVALPEQWVPGTLRVAVTVFPNTLSEVQGGLDGMLREPYGCFEQSSSANYPNVLISEYLRESNQANPDLSRRARSLMDSGYAKLTSFECPRTGEPTRLGYEWFGAKDRPHEALTAYGLVQFTDMARVYPVDADMVRRTRGFLLASRDGTGGFKRNRAAIDSFGRAPDHITDAYIVWALTEAEAGSGQKADLSRELEALTGSDAGKSDPYFLGLVANARLNRGEKAAALPVLKTLAGMQAADGSVPGAKTSITASAGRALLVETTAFAVLGWLKANRPDLFADNVRKAMEWIGGQRNGAGSFGPTQSTVMALKALVAHAKANQRPAETGELTVFVGGVQAAKKTFDNRAPGPVVVELPEKLFKPGRTEVRVETTAAQAYPVSVAWGCRTRMPDSAAEAAVRLSTKLARTELTEGESVTLDVAVENRSETPHGMVVAVVGLPAGLKLPEDFKQLKSLTEKGTIGYFETTPRELVVYWRGMGPKAKTSFAVDLVADVPGEYRGPASRAYVYYDPDQKHWVEPLAVRIRTK